MITDRRVFDEDYLPRTLPHRSQEINQIARAVEPAIHDEPADDLLVHGPSGVGKTALSQHALQRLQERGGVPFAHVESMGRSTAGVLRAVLEGLPGPSPRQNTPQEDLATMLHDRIGRDQPAIAILDEADDLPAIDALDRLADVDGLTLIAICHDPEAWLARVPDDVRHRVSGQEVHLERYGVDELADILAERARLCLPARAVERAQLETIADEVAGVARFGIQSLRAAAEIADEREHRGIQNADVQDAFERARHDVRQAALNSLPFHHHVLYELIRDAGDEGIAPGELHDRYESVADDVYRDRERTPISERSRRNKLRKLVAYDLIDHADGRHDVHRALDERVQSQITGGDAKVLHSRQS